MRSVFTPVTLHHPSRPFRWLDALYRTCAGCLDGLFVFDQGIVRHAGKHVVVMATGSFERRIAVKCFSRAHDFHVEALCYRVLVGLETVGMEARLRCLG